MAARTSLLVGPAASARFEAARRWLSEQPRDTEVLILAPTPTAAAELARAALPPGAAALGWRRMSFGAAAAWLAEETLSARELAPATSIAIEAVWARCVRRLHLDGGLGRFERVATLPGLPKALARTVHELRMARVALGRLPEDVGRCAQLFEDELAAARLVDRAGLLSLAREAVSATGLAAPVLLFDLPVEFAAEAELVRALCARSPAIFATVAGGDARSRVHLEAVLGCTATPLSAEERGTRLSSLQQHVFAQTVPERQPHGDEVVLLSAPGEARECIEVVRKLHQEAARGIPFDRMAVLLRAPGQYRTAMSEALRRGGIPAWFARGTRLPDPSGRALLALLACAEEGLSASRFAEYLSLGELPPPGPEGAPPEPDEEAWAPPDDPEQEDEATELDELVPEREAETAAPPPREPPRAPRRWEQLLVDAAVIGGRVRWERRLEGYAASLRRNLAQLDPEEAQAERIRRDLAQLEALRSFALPLLGELEALPTAGTWGEWLSALTALATRALRRPDRVLSLIAQLAPMADIGPVSLREVRLVLADRLTELTRRPERRREGQLFVGSIEDARGLSFEVVFVPGLAERIFPQKISDDPILPDVDREAVSAELPTRRDRAVAERLHLHLAVGAARERIALSYPRLEPEQGRPRVPSFYGLEVIRAAEGTLPSFTELSRRAEREVPARLAWPAPPDAALAIDATERDLSILDRLFRGEGEPPAGAARYLVSANPHLARALRRHARRLRRAWNVADGLWKPSPEAVDALAAHRLSARAYSPTALQHFAACPYRFLLSAIHRLAPREEPHPLEQLDPLQRGSLVHEVQFHTLSWLRDQGWLPLQPEKLEEALRRLDAILDEVAGEHHEALAPAVERVWRDSVDGIRADLRQWLRMVVEISKDWEPWRFELSFGLSGRDEADPHSTPDPVALENGIRLRGSIDLVERNRDGTLRATDYKTGRARADARTVVGGGEKLQPVLYALTLEKLFPESRVHGGRLFYCTQAGEFSDVTIPLDARARTQASEVAKVIGAAIEKGWFPAAPNRRACEYCDFREVCGENEEARTARKPQEPLAELIRLRSLE